MPRKTQKVNKIEKAPPSQIIQLTDIEQVEEAKNFKDVFYIKKTKRIGKGYAVVIPSMKQKGKNKLMIPIYIKDGGHQSYGFCLQREKDDALWTNKAKEQFKVNLTNQTTEIDEKNIKQAQPRPESRYCQMCKVKYQIYKEHVALESHLTIMRSSPFSQDIAELCQAKKLQRQIQLIKNSKQSVLGPTELEEEQPFGKQKQIGLKQSNENEFVGNQQVKPNQISLLSILPLKVDNGNSYGLLDLSCISKG